MNPLCLLVEVPVCAFRPYSSREYQDTYPVPTPSAVYGMLLSLVGRGAEDNLEARQKSREVHRGVEMVLAVDRQPEQSRVFRKLRRGENLESRRPDYQDLLLNLRLWIWLRSGDDEARPSLPERVKQALEAPHNITRCGGLSLGESSYLVDRITDREAPPEYLLFLVPDNEGFYSLPVWVDHLNSNNTVLCRFSLGQPIPLIEGLATSWFRIGRLCPK